LFLIKEGDSYSSLGYPANDFLKDDESKENLKKLIEIVNSKYNVIAYTFISECWTSFDMSIKPVEDPNKKEVVIMNTTSVVNNDIVIFKINREKDPPKLIELDKTEFKLIDFRFMNLIDKILNVN
jgi:hypothetical protein